MWFSSPFRHQLVAAFGDRFADCLEHGCEAGRRSRLGARHAVNSRTGATSDGSTRCSVGSRSPTKARQQADAGAGEGGGHLDLHAGRSEGDLVVSGDAGEQVEIFDAEQLST